MNKNPYNMAVTLELAQESFAQRNPQTMAKFSDCLYDETTHCFTVPYLGQDYTVSYPAGEVTDAAHKEVDLITAILLVHYLTGASGVALTNNWISFKELQGGSIYIDPFHKRAIQPMLKGFGTQPAAFTRTAALLGGQPASFGDLSYRFPVLPRIPIILILWQGDDEFPPNGNILFDQHANTYLHTEDYAHLASQTVYALLKKI
ncbi:MAG TPA: DUF3786 domain-containing protein [Oscillospiraceae bacterium]|nr:DUF3786 domain-containing protein [Oscillospiraceae bacterium]